MQKYNYKVVYKDGSIANGNIDAGGPRTAIAFIPFQNPDTQSLIASLTFEVAPPSYRIEFTQAERDAMIAFLSCKRCRIDEVRNVLEKLKAAKPTSE